MLKKIDIYGFKSFAEKISLFFDTTQLNGIVGPNGSGKSNIVDGIKWCLGEQALSQIRCKTPLDVIFNGSESKPPLNYCEVTVTFDNTAGIFPVDYTEVAITRKIYRNGETEYFINRVPCRLKDIKELILDTGLGSTGYGIIPQGKVEFVISAKPEERRLLFEETAGVAKFKSKREESLRKLERVKLDMARVEDILAYLKEQMSSLESAVRKAKNYQKYKEELQVLECAYTIKQVEDIDSKLNQLETEHRELLQKYTSYVTELANKESFITKLKFELLEIEKQFLEIKDTLAKINTEISLSTQKIENYKNKIVDLENEIENFNTEIKDTQIKVEHYKEQLNELHNKQSSLKGTVENLEQQQQEHQKKYDEYKKLISEKQSLFREKNKLLNELVYNKTKLQNDLTTLSHNWHRINLDTNSLKKEIESNTKIFNELKTNIDNIKKTISELNEEKIHFETQLKTVTTELQNITETISQKKQSVEEYNKEFYTLNSKIENITTSLSIQPYNFQKIIKYIEESKNPHIYGPIKTILKIYPQHYSLVTSYLGSKLYWFIAETYQDAISLLEELKKNNLGFATFIIKNQLNFYSFPLPKIDITSLLEYDPKWDKIIKFLFSDIEIESDILKTGVVLHGGNCSQEDNEDNLYSIETKLDNLKTKIQKENLELQELEKKYYELLSAKTLFEKKIVDIDNNLAEIEKTRVEKEDYFKTVSELDKTLTGQLNTNLHQLENFQRDMDSLTQEIETLNNEEKNLRTEIAMLSEEITQLQSNEVVEKYLSVNSEYTKIKEQYNNLLVDINTKNELISTSISKIETLKNEIVKQKNLLSTINEEISAEEQKLETLLREKSNFEEKLVEITSALEEKRKLVEETELYNKELITKKDELQQQISSLELKINTEKNNKNNIISWLNEKYNLSFEETKNLYSNVEVDLQQIEKIKKRIDSMGLINLAAPEEYAQLEEKYNTLLSQQQDLIKSEQDIKQAITKINEQISSNFKETFYNVRENFKKICNILFEGGKADLILTNEDNLLETGIEIIVQPPGKKLQNINLLSGGEKSLVALALLFSFFMVKPSPVCILDESDAQLDEANIVRFMKLLKEFSKSTKFILITHNTRSMEYLETIYGVTMEELGVSKVISLKLQKEEEVVSA